MTQRWQSVIRRRSNRYAQCIFISVTFFDLVPRRCSSTQRQLLHESSPCSSILSGTSSILYGKIQQGTVFISVLTTIVHLMSTHASASRKWLMQVKHASTNDIPISISLEYITQWPQQSRQPDCYNPEAVSISTQLELKLESATGD